MGAQTTTSALRYYELAGRVVAVRDGHLGSNVQVVVGDGQGTQRVQVANTTDDTEGARKIRYLDPYGNVRSQGAGFVGDRGFLGKPVDDTGLVQVGARYLDTNLGAFISVDPIMDLADPAQWHGYAYANNNPVTFSDPTGLLPRGPLGDWGPRKDKYGSPSPKPTPSPVTVVPPVQTNSGAGATKAPSVSQLIWQGYTSWLAGVGNGLVTHQQNMLIDGFNWSVGGMVVGYLRGEQVANVVAIANPNGGDVNDAIYTVGNVVPDAATLAIPGVAGVKAPSMASKFAAFGNKIKGLIGRGAANTARAGADDVLNGARLRAQLTGEEISGGHAFQKHVLDQAEFPGITTRPQFASHIEDVVLNGEMRTLSGGRTAYWQNGTVVIRNPGAVDGGTAFRPTTGYDYFLNTLH